MNAEKFAHALNWLKTKFPDVDEQAFFTDYTGQIADTIPNVWAVLQAAEFDASCSECTGNCTLPEALKGATSRPVIRIATSPRGHSYLDVRWTCDTGCKFQQSREFERMFRQSGIKASCRNMTFNAYQCTKTGTETRKARIEAMKASENGSCLILAGRPGSGKTHLAVAIAIRAMEQGRQAIFRLVSAMLDEIQAAISGRGDYDGLMRQFKTVPCLVLDDLGHENMTAARASYLHQIIDYRYTENLQTIVTTNALTPAKLCELSGEDFIAPIISRLKGRGMWLTLANTKDFREREVQNHAS